MFSKNCINLNSADDSHIKWTGWYFFSGQRHPMKFKYVSIIGNQIKARGSDFVGAFNFNGHIHKGQVEMNKKYDGNHSVAYKGQIKNNIISGKWNLGGMSGDFELKMDSKLWSGWSENSGEKKNANFHLNFSSQGIFGMGHDQGGFFCIRGIVKDKNVILTKKYFQKHSIHYRGVIEWNGSKCTLHGYWHRDGVANGRFQLSGVAQNGWKGEKEEDLQVVEEKSRSNDKSEDDSGFPGQGGFGQGDTIGDHGNLQSLDPESGTGGLIGFVFRSGEDNN